MATAYRVLTALIIGALIVLILYYLGVPSGTEIGLLVFCPFAAYWITQQLTSLAVGLIMDAHLLSFVVADRTGASLVATAVLVADISVATITAVLLCTEVTLRPQMQDRMQALGAMVRLITGRYRPIQSIQGGRIVAPTPTGAPLMGPGLVSVSDGNAVVLEQGGKLSRIVGPGSVSTKAGEFVRSIVDLTEQQVKIPVRDAFTRDRIPLQVELNVSYRIDIDPLALQETGEHKFQENTIRKAVCKVSDWKEATRIHAESVTRDVIGMYYLDDLYDPKVELSEYGRSSPRMRLQQQIQAWLDALASECGVRVHRVSIGRIDVPDEVRTTMLNTWKAEWEKQASISRGEGEAEVYRIRENARAQAQMQMIMAITHAFEQARSAGGTAQANLIALRFIEALEKMASDPATKVLLSSNTLDALENMRHSLIAGP